MMAASDSRWSIERLNGDNWTTWKFQTKHVLLAKGLWNITQGTEVLADEADDATTNAYNSRCQNALSLLVMSIETSQLYLITSCETAKDAWEVLKQHFESSA